MFRYIIRSPVLQLKDVGEKWIFIILSIIIYVSVYNMQPHFTAQNYGGKVWIIHDERRYRKMH